MEEYTTNVDKVASPIVVLKMVVLGPPGRHGAILYIREGNRGKRQHAIIPMSTRHLMPVTHTSQGLVLAFHFVALHRPSDQ